MQVFNLGLEREGKEKRKPAAPVGKALGRSFAEQQDMELGARISAMLPQRYSQREVARMMGVSRSAIQRSERLILAKVAKKLMEIANAERARH